MTSKADNGPKSKKLSDAERHARFVETARAIEVDESPEAFDRAFDRLNIKALPHEQTTLNSDSEH